MRSFFISFLVLSLAVTGCCKNKPSGSSGDPASTAKPLAAPPTPVWKERKLSFSEIPARASFLVSDLAYSMSFHKFPAGTHIVVNGKDEAVNDSGTLLTSVDLGEKIAQMAPKDATSFRYKLDPGIKITFKFPGDVTLDVNAPKVSVSFGVKRALGKVQDHPVLFGKESEAKPAQHTILYLGSTVEVFGPATTMLDVDRVAVRDRLPVRQGKMCHGYKDVGAKGTKKRSLPMQMQDEEIIIYARRTGKEIARKKFSASTRCPMFASGGKATTYPDSRAVKRWLRSKR